MGLRNKRPLIGTLTRGAEIVVCRFEPGASLNHAVIHAYARDKYLSRIDMLGGFLTKSSDADESFAGFRAFCENIQLSGQLLALGTVFLRFTSDAGNETGWHGSDRYWGKYIVEWGDELGFDDFDSDIVDESFQCDLIMGATQ
jgi:hypothetical protein